MANGKLVMSDNILDSLPPGVGARDFQTTHVTFVVGELNAT